MQVDSHRRPSNALLLRTLKLAEFYKSCDPEFHFNPDNNPRRQLTKNGIAVSNDGCDNSEFEFILYVKDIIGNRDNQYKIVDILGTGTFGQVVKCIHLSTQRKVAVKIIKNKTAYFNQSIMEIRVLNEIYSFHARQQSYTNGTISSSQQESRKLGNADKSIFQTDIFQSQNQKLDSSVNQDEYELPLIKMYDSFVYKKHLCLVFELLSLNLYDLIKQNGFKGFPIKLVKHFTVQLLDALAILGQAKVIHCDLKPENILLCSPSDTKIKVIDFGSACKENSIMHTYVQSRFYRAPEVLLGLDYSSSVDMWSLGCIVAELFLGLPIFPGTSEYNQISRIHDMLGNFPIYMLEVGKKTSSFFNKSFGVFVLKSISEYSMENNVNEKPSKQYFQQKTLDAIILNYPCFKQMTAEETQIEMYNRHCLIDFISNLLQMNPLKRYSSQQAKMHPFITGKPLVMQVSPKPPHETRIRRNETRDLMTPQPIPSHDKELKKSKSEMLHKKEVFSILKRLPQVGSNMSLNIGKTKNREELKSSYNIEEESKTKKRPTISTNVSFISQGPQSAVLPGKFASNSAWLPKAKTNDDKK